MRVFLQRARRPDPQIGQIVRFGIRKLRNLESGGDVLEESGSLEHDVPRCGGSHRVDPVLDSLTVRGSRRRGGRQVIDRLAVFKPDHPEAEAISGDAQRVDPVDRDCAGRLVPSRRPVADQPAAVRVVGINVGDGDDHAGCRVRFPVDPSEGTQGGAVVFAALMMGIALAIATVGTSPPEIHCRAGYHRNLTGTGDHRSA